jgi:hypothetical protein
MNTESEGGTEYAGQKKEILHHVGHGDLSAG